MGESIPTVDPDDESRPTIALRANSVRQKAEWERAVETSDEYANLSHLIKRAVSRELAGAYDRDMGGSTVDERQLGEVMDTLEALESTVDGLSSDVEEATQAMYVSDTSISEDTTTELYAALPTAFEEATTPKGVAAGTDIDPETATVALAQMSENIPAVKRIDYEEISDGETTETIEWAGQEMEIDTGADGVKRKVPLYFKQL